MTTAVDTLERAAVAAAPDTADAWRQGNLLTVARLVARAALRREESRGGHFRADFPARDDARWKIHVVDMRARNLRQDKLFVSLSRALCCFSVRKAD